MRPMREWEDFDHIDTQVCDSCGRRRPGTQLHCRGTPVMFLCDRPLCGGHLVFERVSRADIDAWLDGEWARMEDGLAVTESGFAFRVAS